MINFGAAANIGARRITFTNLAQVVGASEYIFPEKLNGKRGDARSYIYSLGVMTIKLAAVSFLLSAISFAIPKNLDLGGMVLSLSDGADSANLSHRGSALPMEHLYARSICTLGSETKNYFINTLR